MSQFITNTELTYHIDYRRIGDLLTQDNERASLATITDSSSSSGAIVLLMIQTASEQIVAAATVGNRYTRDILDNLAATGTGSAFLLKRLTAMLTFGLLVSRRALPPEQVAAMAPEFQAAQEYLELLRRGDRIFFDVPDVAEAGLPTTASMTPTALAGGPPTWTQTAGRFFGCSPTALNNPPSPWPYGYRNGWY